MSDCKSLEPDGRPLRYLSAFSGVGGLDLGVERAGFEVIGGIENDAAARRSLTLNRPRFPQLLLHDVNDAARDLRPSGLGIGAGELALLAAGPPCQPFSKAAQWSRTGALGMRDEGTRRCLEGLMTLVDRFLPRALLIENVPGFVKGERSALSLVRERLAAVNERCGTRYRLSHRVLNVADYGIPQRRRRAIVVALRDGAGFAWPAATHHDRPVRAWDALRNTRPVTAPTPSGRFANLLASVPEGENYQYFTEQGDGPDLFGYRRRFWSFLLKLAKDEPAWTVPANPGPATGPFHWESRPLAPEEVLRLQSFPRSWRLDGGHREQIRQAGNATPPLLAEILGRALAVQLVGAHFLGRPTLTIRRSARVPPPAPVSPVASEYLSLAGRHDPHPGPGRGPSPRRETTVAPDKSDHQGHRRSECAAEAEALGA
ncbi:MAG: DNA cytosine methyltransferase [Acidobacteria bacterium]|nr:DNA cytosine methyltransferase [Acidobacteriota bacterium]